MHQKRSLLMEQKVEGEIGNVCSQNQPNTKDLATGLKALLEKHVTAILARIKFSQPGKKLLQ